MPLLLAIGDPNLLECSAIGPWNEPSDRNTEMGDRRSPVFVLWGMQRGKWAAAAMSA